MQMCGDGKVAERWISGYFAMGNSTETEPEEYRRMVHRRPNVQEQRGTLEKLTDRKRMVDHVYSVFIFACESWDGKHR